MSGEWKPGDVALMKSRAAIGPCNAVRAKGGVWHCQHGKTIDEKVEWARPLVVIDPEDREQVERVLRVFYGVRSVSPVDTEDMQAALREFANPTPPRPEEPSGLGAVVEDDEGDQWVLINVTGSDVKPARQWRTWWGHRPYSEIAAVRVLNQGVTS